MDSTRGFETGFCVSLLAVMGIATAAVASDPPVTFQLSIDPTASTLDIDFGLGLSFAGSLIGDYDAKSNPEGTRTVPGIFGNNNANLPIPLTGGVGLSIQTNGAPESEVEFVIGDGPLGWVRGLSFGFVQSGPTGVLVDLSFEWDTFRTFQPTFLYPGGIPLNLSLPVFDVTSIGFQQGQLATAVYLPADDQGNRFFFSLVPGAVTIEGTLLGEALTLTTPLPVPIFGTLTAQKDGYSVDVTFSLSESFSVTLPLPALPPIPFELPTLPDQPTSGVLLTIDIDGLSGNAVIDAEFSGNAVPTYSIADLNEDGLVNGLDMNGVLSSWGPVDGTPESMLADINQNGIVNGADLMLLISEWLND